MRYLVISFVIFSLFRIVHAQTVPGDGNLPDRFPDMEVLESNNPSEGLIFAAPLGEWGPFEGTDPYLAIYDNYGTPVFFQEQSMRAFDFKQQANGTLTYYGGTLGYPHHALNEKFEFIRNFHPENVNDDFHEFIILEDSSYFMLGLDSRVVDMDTVIEGGHKGVVVDGNVVQYFDQNDSLLFNWSTWDYFLLLDANDYIVDLTDPDHIDLVHANSIEKDTDTTILLSCRNFDEITKINLLTSGIIWRMGGKNNMFTFGHDTCYFHMQHDVRKLSNGNISVHDNNYPDFMDRSRAVVYEVDEENMTVNMVASYPQNYPGFDQGLIMGNSQFNQDGSVFIGWGSGTPNITEYHADGSTALIFNYGSVSYRVFKFNWKPKAITLSHDILYFGTVKPGIAKTMKLSIFNNLSSQAEINYIHSHSDEFTVVSELPVVVDAGSGAEIILEFMSETEGSYKDILTLCWDFKSDGFNNRIAAQVKTNGIVDLNPGIEEDQLSMVRVYPNPARDQLFVDPGDFSGNIQTMKLLNSFGQMIFENEIDSRSRFSIPFANLEKGVYYLIFVTGKGSETRRVVKY